jgi:hypothetical protein
MRLVHRDDRPDSVERLRQEEAFIGIEDHPHHAHSPDRRARLFDFAQLRRRQRRLSDGRGKRDTQGAPQQDEAVGLGCPFVPRK